MRGLFPEGLTRKAFDMLGKCSKEFTDLSKVELLGNARAYLDNIRRAHEKNIFVNFKLAEAIFNTMESVVAQWDILPSFCQPWFKGMMKYFTLTTDLENDLTSPIGFDDDADMLNACLRLAGRDDWCINPEDFDDV